MAAGWHAAPATNPRPAGESGFGTSGLHKSGLHKSGLGESEFGSGMPFSRMQIRLAALSGWRRAGIAIVFGALPARQRRKANLPSGKRHAGAEIAFAQS